MQVTMALNYFCNSLRYLAVGCLAVLTLTAAEYHGTVQSRGLRVPGATVTAVQGERKLTTTTDDQGAFQLPDLPDGTWQIQVEMLGFEPLTRRIVTGSPTPAVAWDLHLMTEQALIASLQGEPRRAVPVAAAAENGAAEKPRETPPAGVSAEQAPLPAEARPQAAASDAPTPDLAAARKRPRTGKKGKSGSGDATASASNSFQRLTVSQSAATSTLETEGTIKKE